MSTERLVATPSGDARATTSEPAADPLGTLVLGHGAGGLRWTRDVTAVRDAAIAAGWVVVLVDQPWRVAGKRMGPLAPVLDPAWTAVVAALPDTPLLVVGGRSAGARVACRTAVATGADHVLALSFPLHPPGRPERSRADELGRPDAAGLPVDVVQGATDPWGRPDELRVVAPETVTLTEVTGTHSLDRAAGQVAAAVLPVLARVIPRAGARETRRAAGAE